MTIAPNVRYSVKTFARLSFSLYVGLRITIPRLSLEAENIYVCTKLASWYRIGIQSNLEVSTHLN